MDTMVLGNEELVCFEQVGVLSVSEIWTNH